MFASLQNIFLFLGAISVNLCLTNVLKTITAGSLNIRETELIVLQYCSTATALPQIHKTKASKESITPTGL
jgi:hypothetical protein